LQLPPGLSHQFFSEVFPERVQIDILYDSMLIMHVSLFGSALGLAGTDPVGRFVAGALKPISFNKGFQQIQGIMIGINPVIGDSSDI